MSRIDIIAQNGNDGEHYMKREDRYIVLKRKDIEKYLDVDSSFMLMQICSHIRACRIKDNKIMDKNYVVVAEDWPMYEDTWKAIEGWVDNEQR